MANPLTVHHSPLTMRYPFAVIRGQWLLANSLEPVARPFRLSATSYQLPAAATKGAA